MRLYLFMSKKNKKGGSRQSGKTKRKQRQISPKTSILRRIAFHLSPTGWFWASVGLMLSFVGSYFLLRTQVSIEPDVSLDPSNAGATLFRFTNQGVLPIYDIHRDLTAKSLGDPARNNWLNNANIKNTPPNIKKLSSGESTTINIPILGLPIQLPKYTQGEVVLDFSYKDWIGITHNKPERFQCLLGTDGAVHWFHKAIDE